MGFEGERPKITNVRHSVSAYSRKSHRLDASCTELRVRWDILPRSRGGRSSMEVCSKSTNLLIPRVNWLRDYQIKDGSALWLIQDWHKGCGVGKPSATVADGVKTYVIAAVNEISVQLITKYSKWAKGGQDRTKFVLGLRMTGTATAYGGWQRFQSVIEPRSKCCWHTVRKYLWGHNRDSARRRLVEPYWKNGYQWSTEKGNVCLATEERGKV